MGRVLRPIGVILSSLVVLLVQFLSVLPDPVQAVTPYEASDVLGQRNPDGSANFTKANANNGESNPGATGLHNGGNKVLVDSQNHRLFVADASNSRILIFNLNTDGSFEDRIADYVLGQPDFTTTTSASSGANTIYNPSGLAYDSIHQRLFVASGSNSNIRVFDLSGGITNNMNATYVLGYSDFSTIGGYTCDSRRFGGADIAYSEAQQYLYVSDNSQHRLLVFNLSSGITSFMSASYVLGQTNLTTCSGSDTNAKGFNSPRSLALDTTNHHLFVADTLNFRVLVFDTTTITNNEDAVYVLGQADFTSAGYDTNAKGFQSSGGSGTLYYDSSTSYLYASDSWNARILVFNLLSGITNNMDASFVLGQSDFTSGGWGGSAQTFNGAGGLSIDETNHTLYFTDFINRVLLFDLSSGVSNYMTADDILGQTDSSGSPIYTQSSVNNIGNPGQNSMGLGGNQYGASTAIDTVHHRLFVGDGYNYRILVFNLDSNNNLTDHSADNVLGCESLTSSNCYYQSNWFYYPGSLAYDSVYDRLFVFDGYEARVVVFDTSTITDGEDGIYTIGQDDPSTSSIGVTADRFGGGDSYGGIALNESTQQLFVTDLYLNKRVLVFDISPEHVATGMDASYVIGSPNFTAIGGGSCSATEISSNDGYGGGIAVDSTHNRLFVENYGCEEVLIYDTSSLSNGMSASNVLGCYDFSCSTWGTNQSWIYYASGLSYDSVQQLLYVYDANYSRVLIFDVAEISNGENAIGVFGQSDYSSSSTGVTQTAINPDYYIGNFAFDSTNRRLYFPDDNNKRVLVYSFAHLPETLPLSSVGVPYSTSLNDYSQGTTTFSVIAGALPTGMSLDSSTGVLSGTPVFVGTYTFTISLSDDNGVAGTFTDTQEYTMNIGFPSTAKPDGENSTTEAPSCNDQVASAPDLFQVDRSATSATVHFAPLSDSVSSYLISYGTGSTAEGYSLELPMSHADGAVAQDINSLNPSSTYYIKVRAQKGCMPGDWSGVKEASIQRSYTTISSSPVYQSHSSSNKTTSKSFPKKILKKTAKSAKKTTKPKSITTHKSTKPWYMFW